MRRTPNSKHVLILTCALVTAACIETDMVAPDAHRRAAVEQAWGQLQTYAQRQEIARLQITAITYAVSDGPHRGADLARSDGSNLRCEIDLRIL